MSNLILIRHSQSRQDPAQPASQWGLTDEGRRRCVPLADRLARYGLAAVVTSRERKAAETGALVAARLGLPAEQAEGLHEHQRERAAFLPHGEFERTIAAFFARPGDLVFGEETASQAAERFDRVVSAVLASYPRQSIAIVSHGTVMTLFVAQHAGVEPLDFWKRLGMPAAVVLALPQLELVEVISYGADGARTAPDSLG
jgi:broad specificity phosphatase PhoE